MTQTLTAIEVQEHYQRPDTLVLFDPATGAEKCVGVDPRLPERTQVAKALSEHYPSRKRVSMQRYDRLQAI